MLLSVANAAPPAVIAPDAAEIVARIRAYTGDPYTVPGLHFVFAVGETRREHDWDVRHGRVAVRYTREDGAVCTVRTAVGYDGPDEAQRAAWAMFVNDQFWLLAPAKIAEDGAQVTRTGTGVLVRYEGVGVTPGDAYSFEVDPDGAVRAWTFSLASGRTGTWTWAPATAIGPLRLSLERTNGEKTLRFEDVRVGRVKVGEPGVDCATP